MSKSLVIVESPAKAKTINKYLGSDYIVEASVGHVKDLPKGGLSIDVEGGFLPTYEIIAGKQEVIKRLKNLASRCDSIFLATDPDREGEAIAHHIAEEIRAPRKRIQRVLFNEITKPAITAAMKAPRDIDAKMVAAQEARRVMDRLIGYKVSPFLWKTFTGQSRGLSAGRVQSVALRLVVERERAINSFIPIEYWSLIGLFRTRKDEEISARLVRFDGMDIRNPNGSAVDLKEEDRKKFINTKADAEALRERALREEYSVVNVATKEVKRSAPLPFTTSTLQQDAGRRLKFNTKKTMQLAQKLYEGVELGKRGLVGLVTYMRTDSVRVSDEAADAAEQFVYENYGKEYIRGTGRPRLKAPKSAAKVQDAHEAIRPTDVTITPKEAKKHLDADQAALYELIWSRFIASQMADAIFDQTTLDIEGGPFLFRATGRVTRFKGWLQVYSEAEEEEAPADSAGAARRGGKKKGEGPGGSDEQETDRILPQVSKGESLRLEKIETKQSFTKPPLRYTESLLVKEMEAKGIGRPSTYSSIISTIQERGYVEQRERKLHATDLGMMVCDALVNGFPALFDVKFTAKMEEELDTIAGGKSSYLDVLRRFYRPLDSSLKSAGNLGAPANRGGAAPKRLRSGSEGAAVSGSSTEPRRASKKPAGVKSDLPCNLCGSAMEEREGRYGPYLACLAFPTCRNIVSLKKGSSAPPPTASEPGAPAVICEKCGSPMVRRAGKNGDFYGCTGYPNCRHTRPVPLGIKCPLCGTGEIGQRVGGRYKSVFYGCSRYPDCRFTSSLKPVNTPCPSCGNSWMAQAWSETEGDFLECQKCRKKVV